MNGMFRARVVDVRPEANAVDIVLLADGRRFPGVPVLSGFAGGDYGFTGFGEPSETGYEARGTRKRDVFAVGAFIDSRPIVLGFYYPQVGQMQFEEKGRMVFRHPSDLYVTIDDAANMEIAHPSGLFMRVGTGTEHEDLSGRDYDGRWKIERNADQQAGVYIETPGGAKVNVDAEGNVTITSKVAKVVADEVRLDAAKTIIDGRLTVNGSIHAKGSIGATGDVIAKDGLLSMAMHKHPANNTPAVEGGAAMPPADD